MAYSEGAIMWSLSENDFKPNSSHDHFQVKIFDDPSSSTGSLVARAPYNYRGLELYRGFSHNIKIVHSETDSFEVEFLNNMESVLCSPIFCPKGKRAYFEVTFEHVGSNPKVGFCSEYFEASVGQYFDSWQLDGDFWAVSSNSMCYENGEDSESQEMAEWRDGSVIGIMCDFMHDTIVAFHDGQYQHMFASDSLRGIDRLFPMLICDSSRMLVNFGQQPFVYPHFSFLPIQSFVGCTFDPSLNKKSSMYDSLCEENRCAR
jgi:hypothetical protein